MSCEGCLTTQKGSDSSLEQIKVEAKKYAKENKISVAIYKEGFEWHFTTAQEAIQNGYPTIEYISQY